MALIDKDKYKYPILQACSEGNLEKVKQLIEEFDLLNNHLGYSASSHFFDSAFTQAINNEHFDVALYLVLKDPSSITINEAIYIWIHSEVEGSEFGIRGIIPDDPTNKIKFFLSIGSDINYLDSSFQTALDYALINYPKAEEALIKFGGKKGEEVKELVLNPLKLTQLAQYELEFKKATEAGQVEEFSRLIEEFNQLNKHVVHAAERFLSSSFMQAVKHKHFELATYILQKAKDYEVLEKSLNIKRAILTLIELILSETERERSSVLHTPLIVDDPTEQFKFLLELGADINYRDLLGYTALDSVIVFLNWPKAVEALTQLRGKRGKELKKQEAQD